MRHSFCLAAKMVFFMSRMDDVLLLPSSFHLLPQLLKGQQAAQGIVGRDAGCTRGSCQTDAFKGPQPSSIAFMKAAMLVSPAPVPDRMQSGT